MPGPYREGEWIACVLDDLAHLQSVAGAEIEVRVLTGVVLEHQDAVEQHRSPRHTGTGLDSGQAEMLERYSVEVVALHCAQPFPG